jgi:DNA polymerase
MEKAVSRDRHKMTAFVRFRLTERDGEPWYIAFHSPDHYIVRLTASFFARRFAPMKWAILTPDESVWWDTSDLTFGPGVAASEAPPADELEGLWRTYYAGIFNPARIKLKAMKREMPVRHWATLPETELIPDLLRDAPRRVEEMMATQKRNARKAGKTPPGRQTHEPAEIKVTEKEPAATGTADGPKYVDPDTCAVGKSAAEFLPTKIELPQLRAAAAGCRGCAIYCNATQTVFGEGPIHASVMFVGEQPGDQEDRAGKPFVGPAGQLLDRALEEAGVPRADCYVTNAVKHFKWEPRGKRRIHSKPSAREVTACRPWLEAEIQAIQPKTIVCLGATAAQSLLGRDFRVTQHRGEPLKADWADWVLATVHPSSLLRIPDAEQREVSYAQFVDDLRLVARRITGR